MQACACAVCNEGGAKAYRTGAGLVKGAKKKFALYNSRMVEQEEVGKQPYCDSELALSLSQSPVSQQRSLLAMEAAMREEIRELHEQRAGAMMSEIVELQKERDLAVAKLKRLEKKVKGTTTTK